MIKQAIIPLAGLGTRLLPLTSVFAKELLPINGKPGIEYIIDDSHLKQNRFSPGTHMPIVSNSFLEKHKPDVLVVFAYEYIDDIKKKTKSSYRYLIPIPPKEVH